MGSCHFMLEDYEKFTLFRYIAIHLNLITTILRGEWLNNLISIKLLPYSKNMNR